jgi:hypothetical protein
MDGAGTILRKPADSVLRLCRSKSRTGPKSWTLKSNARRTLGWSVRGKVAGLLHRVADGCSTPSALFPRTLSTGARID